MNIQEPLTSIFTDVNSSIDFGDVLISSIFCSPNDLMIFFFLKYIISKCKTVYVLAEATKQNYCNSESYISDLIQKKKIPFM